MYAAVQALIIFFFFFFCRSPFYRVRCVRETNVAVLSRSCRLPCSLTCRGTVAGHTVFLCSWKRGQFWRMCSAFWSLRPQSQVGDGASFNFLFMWDFRRLWPVRSLMIITCCRRSRNWMASLVGFGRIAAFTRALFSMKLTLLSGCASRASSLVN